MLSVTHIMPVLVSLSVVGVGTRHVKCYSYHACTSVTVSGWDRNATVHDPKPYI